MSLGGEDVVLVLLHRVLAVELGLGQVDVADGAGEAVGVVRVLVLGVLEGVGELLLTPGHVALELLAVAPLVDLHLSHVLNVLDMDPEVIQKSRDEPKPELKQNKIRCELDY